MNIFKIIIDFIRSLFMHKPPKPQPLRRPMHGTAKLTWATGVNGTQQLTWTSTANGTQQLTWM